MSTASSTNALAQAPGAVIQEIKQPEKSVAWVEKLKGIVEDFRATGSITDADGKLYLDSKEVSTVIRAVGIYPTEVQMKKFLEEACVESPKCENFKIPICTFVRWKLILSQTPSNMKSFSGYCSD